MLLKCAGAEQPRRHNARPIVSLRSLERIGNAGERDAA